MLASDRFYFTVIENHIRNKMGFFAVVQLQRCSKLLVIGTAWVKELESTTKLRKTGIDRNKWRTIFYSPDVSKKASFKNDVRRRIRFTGVKDACYKARIIEIFSKCYAV